MLANIRGQGYTLFMITIKEITDDQALAAIKNREFEPALLDASPNVAIILTQDWCSQWKNVQSWLSQINTEDTTSDCAVFTLVYNQKQYFHEFMNFKESVFQNDRIPYIRFYKNGTFSSSSNFVTKEQFLRIIA
jgi:hypothetical protein